MPPTSDSPKPKPHSSVTYHLNRMGRLLNEADFDDDTRPSIQIVLPQQPPAPEPKNSLSPIPRRWRKWGLLAFVIASAIAGAAVSLKELLR